MKKLNIVCLTARNKKASVNKKLPWTFKVSLYILKELCNRSKKIIHSKINFLFIIILKNIRLEFK